MGHPDERPGDRRPQLARPVYLRLDYCTGVDSGPNHERCNSQHIWVGHILLPEWGIDHVENAKHWSWEKAAERNAKFHDYCHVINSAVHCKFHEFASYNLTDLLGTINTCTGLNWSQEEMRRCGDRITHLQKLLNIRYGWKTADDFNSPKRFMEPVSEEVAAGKIPVALDEAIVDYYRYRRWDDKGYPTSAKLKENGTVVKAEDHSTIEIREGDDLRYVHPFFGG